MKKKIFLRCIIVFLVIIFGYESYSYLKDINNINNKVLEDIKTIDIFDNKDKTLSIKVQSGGENDFNWYESTEKNNWPDYTKYTYVGTECTDSSGSKVEDAKQYVQFDEKNNEATITTKKTLYCTLYFGKGRPALEVLDNQGGTYYGGGKQGSRAAVQGLYRFKGTYSQVTNNYICIGGPLNPDTCGSTDDNKYLYRIIGVTDGTENEELGLEKGMLKVIKVIPSSTSQVWTSDSSKKNIDWDNDNNTVRTKINGEGFYNGLDTGIQNIISPVKWWKGDHNGSSSNPPTSETTIKTTSQYHVGLMYASDYYNSWTYADSNNPNTDSWLNITHTMSGKANTYKNTNEWTMSRYGTNSDDFSVWYVTNNGYLTYQGVWYPFAIRPVFFLPSTTGLVGNGTETSPYIIISLSNA